MRAAELCNAIERGDVMKVPGRGRALNSGAREAFAKLDQQTASCPHPDTGQCAAHYSIARGSCELLRMATGAGMSLLTALRSWKQEPIQTPEIPLAKRRS